MNFCPFHFGFRTGQCTETTLLDQLNDVYTAGDDDRRFGLDTSAPIDATSCRLQAEILLH